MLKSPNLSHKTGLPPHAEVYPSCAWDMHKKLVDSPLAVRYRVEHNVQESSLG